jgi:DNA-binding SARP family transcriptional activator/TolB-like protein
VSGPTLHLRLLGPVTVLKDGVELPLPASRKVRALLALLAVASPITRSRLCELLWDAPNDPRSELRWCLSKLRGVLDDPARSRVRTENDTVALDLSECFVDIVELANTLRAGIDALDLRQLRAISGLFAGDFAEGLQIDRDPQFASWLSAQRRRFRLLHVTVLEQLSSRLAGDDSEELFEHLEKWLQVSPFDQRAHELLLRALAQRGRIREAEEHLASTIQLFETEGLDWLPIRACWHAARAEVPHVEWTVPERPRGSGGTESGQPDVVTARRAAICIMPFVDRTPTGTARGALADGLTEDIITRLAKLRALFVIARGSVFALRERNIPPQEAGRLLNVDYVASGSVQQGGGRIVVTVELAETKVSRIVWADEFTCKPDDAWRVPDEIGNRIVASIAEEIEAAERNRAILKPPNCLDAWEAYHRGLWHMYRFSSADNDRAAHFFQMSLRQDPTFARAHAGLSFTHFQNAFLLRPAERQQEIERAYETAGNSLIADDRDPAAHWAMGRALWLRGNQDEALREIEGALALSPNFALGHYTLGFVHGQSGDPRVAIASADYSRHLSPFDPLMFGMLCSRALGHLRLGQYQDAADWAIRGAARPNAHVHILGIAATCLGAAGRIDEARTVVTSLRKSAPTYGVGDLLAAFRFGPDGTALFRQNAAAVGLE